MKTFTVTAYMTFQDGYNKGNLKVRASCHETAKTTALSELRRIWKDALTIEILKIKP